MKFTQSIFLFILILTVNVAQSADINISSANINNMAHVANTDMDCCSEQVHDDCVQCYANVALPVNFVKRYMLQSSLLVSPLDAIYASIILKIPSTPPIV